MKFCSANTIYLMFQTVNFDYIYMFLKQIWGSSFSELIYLNFHELYKTSGCESFFVKYLICHFKAVYLKVTFIKKNYNEISYLSNTIVINLF